MCRARVNPIDPENRMHETSAGMKTGSKRTADTKKRGYDGRQREEAAAD